MNMKCDVISSLKAYAEKNIQLIFLFMVFVKYKRAVKARSLILNILKMHCRSSLFLFLISIESHGLSLQDFLESKNDACRNFISQLNESLAVWGGRLPVEARYVILTCVQYL